MRDRKSSTYLDQNELNLLLDNENKKNNKRKKITDAICYLIHYISLIPTVVYNTVWFFYLKSLLEKADIFLDSIDKIQNKSCHDIINWTNYAFAWTIIANIKAILLLVCAKFCCGQENDCNMFCLLIKSLTSLIPSFIFVIKIPDYVKSYNYSSETIPINNEANHNLTILCDNIANTISSFYHWEYGYVLFALSIFCLIPLGAACMGLKEYWKSRGYNKNE